MNSRRAWLSQVPGRQRASGLLTYGLFHPRSLDGGRDGTVTLSSGWDHVEASVSPPLYPSFLFSLP